MKTYLVQQKRTICQYQSATISADSSQEAIEIFNQPSDEDKQWQETDHQSQQTTRLAHPKLPAITPA